MALIAATDATVVSVGTIQFTPLAAPSRGSRENSVWRIHMAPGSIADGTHQVTREEVFVALSGTAYVTLGDRSLTLSAGSALVVPPNTDFSLSNSSDDPFEAVVVLPVGGQAVVQGQTFTPPWAR